MRPLVAFGLGALLLAGCGQGPRDEVVILAPHGMEGQVTAWFEGSGIDVVVHAGERDEIVASLINRTERPAADLLVTAGVGDIWRAAERGALRPLAGDAVSAVPGALKDPDRAWVAVGFSPALIAVAGGLDASAIRHYADLGSPAAAGRLCLVSAADPGMRVLIAMLIETFGERKAEDIVRLWVRNLALPPFETQDALFTALGSGDCEMAIVFAAVAAGATRTVYPDVIYFTSPGIGISRHAPRPEAAQRAIDYLVSRFSTDDPAQFDGIGTAHIGTAGWLDEDARLLAERAGYR
ncbi:MAG TPA: hypothetical protein VIS31_01435 [Woeseiaceae bacterium]